MFADHPSCATPLFTSNSRTLAALYCRAAGAVTLPDGSVQQLLSESEAALVQRFDPSAPLDTIGFFIAKFEKAAAA
jgi:16S rRNA C967 or C1407 C5-methylase (RsmB/RsmF family)